MHFLQTKKYSEVRDSTLPRCFMMLKSEVWVELAKVDLVIFGTNPSFWKLGSEISEYFFVCKSYILTLYFWQNIANASESLDLTDILLVAEVNLTC